MQTQNTDALRVAIQNEGTIRMDKQRLYTEEEHQFVLDLLQGKKEEEVSDDIAWEQYRDDEMHYDSWDSRSHFDAGCAHVRSQQSAKNQNKK